jgi:xylose dehydrogenase (NAD/NADP)
VSDPWRSIGTGIELAVGDRRPEYFDIADANPYACELDDFAAAVAGERPPRLGLADALGQARTIEAVLTAAESGRRVSV